MPITSVQKPFYPDEENDLKQLRDAAEHGDIDAQFELGSSLFFGDGVKQDVVEALKWFRKAAEQGHADAKTALRLLGY